MFNNTQNLFNQAPKNSSGVFGLIPTGSMISKKIEVPPKLNPDKNMPQNVKLDVSAPSLGSKISEVINQKLDQAERQKSKIVGPVPTVVNEQRYELIMFVSTELNHLYMVTMSLDAVCVEGNNLASKINLYSLGIKGGKEG
jgi:hypothetical protein